MYPSFLFLCSDRVIVVHFNTLPHTEIQRIELEGGEEVEQRGMWAEDEWEGWMERSMLFIFLCWFSFSDTDIILCLLHLLSFKKHEMFRDFSLSVTHIYSAFSHFSCLDRFFVKILNVILLLLLGFKFGSVCLSSLIHVHKSTQKTEKT